MIGLLKSPWAIIAVLSLSLAGGWLWHQSRIKTVQLELQRTEAGKQQAEGALGRSVVQYENLRREKVAAEDSTRALQAKLATVDTRHTAIRKQINAAPATDDGPLAPVLRDTLRALRDGAK